MQFFFLVSALAASALALPNGLEPRQQATSCGSTYYTSSDVSAAARASCNYLSRGTTAGGSKYPERYNDYEGFRFNGVSSPYYEFPILANDQIYSGGSPGPDRVIINSNCEFAGTITHTGASNNAFKACSGTS